MAASKQNYRIQRKLEVFYTGGPARLSGNGRVLACACADEVKVSMFKRCVRADKRTGADQTAQH